MNIMQLLAMALTVIGVVLMIVSTVKLKFTTKEHGVSIYNKLFSVGMVSTMFGLMIFLSVSDG